MKYQLYYSLKELDYWIHAGDNEDYFDSFEEAYKFMEMLIADDKENNINPFDYLICPVEDWR